MVDRNKYDQIIDSLRLVSSHHEDCGLEASIREICDTKNSFDIKLMFVGHFNAGKSSLLNALIGRPGFLREAQLPQTAVAAELSYSETESAFAFRRDGSKEPLTEQATLSPNEYTHLKYCLPSPSLEQVSDYTIVDTPGFDSNMEAHAKALAGYIGKGSAYVVVVDQEKGGIDDATLSFVGEISQYSSQIAILINKCDKITKETANDIADCAKNTLLSRGYSYPVYTISTRDADASDKLLAIISSFHAQAAFDRMMERKLQGELAHFRSFLQVMRQKLYLDTFDLDTEIHAYTRAGECAKEVFASQREKALRDLDSTAAQVVGEARAALEARADLVAEAILSGNQSAVEAIIIETVRPIMLSSMQNISTQQINSVSAALDFSGLSTPEEQTALTETVAGLALKLKDQIEQGVFFDSPFGNQEKSDRRKAYYIVSGATAILTDVIYPWLEVVIVLLPDIVDLAKKFFGESDQDKLKRRFITNVIPQICNKIHPQVQENIEVTTQQVLSKYQDMLEEKLKQIQAGIEAAEARKREKTDAFEIYKHNLNEDLDLIQNLIQQMG